MDFGDKVKELRKQRNLTQAQLAEKLGLGESTISFYESNKRRPNYEILDKIASFFQVPVEYLLYYDGNIVDYKQDIINEYLKLQNEYFDNKNIKNEEVKDSIKNNDDLIFQYLRRFPEQEVKDLKQSYRQKSGVSKIRILDRITKDKKENIIGYKKIAADQVSDGGYFYLKVRDDSMKGVKINKGDLVLVRQQNKINNGDIAVVLVEGKDEAIIRTVFKLESKNKDVKINKYHLQPQNHDYDIIIREPEKVYIIGKCIEGTYKIKNN
ncbi:MAG: helix-turn-helix domain-containing protein [Halanaerobiales bacterium]